MLVSATFLPRNVKFPMKYSSFQQIDLMISNYKTGNCFSVIEIQYQLNQIADFQFEVLIKTP